ncbi:MAG TPA: hypothetical protein VKS25_02415 [Solirubrobacteraceae bacterium]|nr:hypothetical protein [Solirubrobacteraceae bacterium]
MGLRTLDAAQAEALERLCDVIVPGSARVGPAVYIDAQLAAMPDAVRSGVIAAIERLGESAHGGAEALAEHAPTPDFLMLRAMAVEAFYSDFIAPGRDVTRAWDEIDFHPPAAAALHKDWSYLGIEG